MLLVLIRIGMILLSWVTTFFLPKKSFFKYLPVALFFIFNSFNRISMGYLSQVVESKGWY